MHPFGFLASSRFSRYLKLALLLWDLVLLNGCYLLSFYLRFGDLSRFELSESRAVLLIANMMWLVLTIYFNAYKIIRIEGIEPVLIRAFKIILLHIAFIFLTLVILKFTDISRFSLVYFYGLLFAAVTVSRIVVLRLLKRLRTKGYNYRTVVIVGNNEVGINMARLLSRDLGYGFQVVGLFGTKREDAEVTPDISYLGEIDRIESYLQEFKINELFITLQYNDAETINKVIQLCERYMVRLKFIPDFHRYTKNRHVEITFYESTPVLMFQNEPLEIATNRLIKRVFDILFSIAVIVFVFTWLFPILMLIVKIGSKGPIFFKQERSGEGNRSFVCYKFRTMRVNAFADELQATQNDPRITKMGAFMRKTNLDEFPQFFNVFWGNMSIVGPRPHMLKHTEQYSSLINNYLVRHFAKPGITGWAQVNGYRGETRELIDMQKRVEYDIWYIENWSFLLDLKIIFKTLTNMIGGDKKAY